MLVYFVGRQAGRQKERETGREEIREEGRKGWGRKEGNQKE